MDALFQKWPTQPRLVEKLEAVRDILTSEGRTLAQGALAWLWARSKRTLPIPGFKSIAQAEKLRRFAPRPLAAEQMPD
jgi:aryl-alcohol dehydrogenase-like predicted oxidoreductase